MSQFLYMNVLSLNLPLRLQLNFAAYTVFLLCLDKRRSIHLLRWPLCITYFILLFRCLSTNHHSKHHRGIDTSQQKQDHTKNVANNVPIRMLRDRSSILPGEGAEDNWEGDQNSAHSEGGGMRNKEHFKRMSMKFLLKSWSGDQHFLHKSEWGCEFHQIYENVFHPLPKSY